MDQIDEIVQAVIRRLHKEKTAALPGGETLPGRETLPGGEPIPGADDIPAEMSARHVHLSREDLKALFGLDQLECVREISQPGQFLSSIRVRLIGPKGVIDNVAVLGPVRSATQVEISLTDARTLGLQPPVRLSGDLEGAAMIAISAGGRIIQREAAIAALRHLHMTPGDAAAFHVSNGQEVSVRVLGSRPLVMEGVVVRVSEQAALALHMDTDEANAAGAGKDCRCRIVAACSDGAACRKEHAPAEGTAPPVFEGKLITEQNVRTLQKSGVKALVMRRGQLITPLARDALKAAGITLTVEESQRP